MTVTIIICNLVKLNGILYFTTSLSRHESRRSWRKGKIYVPHLNLGKWMLSLIPLIGSVLFATMICIFLLLAVHAAQRSMLACYTQNNFAHVTGTKDSSYSAMMSMSLISWLMLWGASWVLFTDGVSLIDHSVLAIFQSWNGMRILSIYFFCCPFIFFRLHFLSWWHQCNSLFFIKKPTAWTIPVNNSGLVPVCTSNHQILSA